MIYYFSHDFNDIGHSKNELQNNDVARMPQAHKNGETTAFLDLRGERRSYSAKNKEGAVEKTVQGIGSKVLISGGRGAEPLRLAVRRIMDFGG
jgi:hypothetical protein